MLMEEQAAILARSRDAGWVSEPEAKRLLALGGLEVPRFVVVQTVDQGTAFAREVGYPLVAKVVSPQVIHKTDAGGVVTDIRSEGQWRQAFERLRAIQGWVGVLLEEMLEGLELIVGAKVDEQFGPVILLGMGGTEAEIYRDTSLRMAPLRPRDAASMVRGLKAHDLLEGYRGREGVALDRLTELMVTFSHLVMDMEEVVESVDLNPVLCSSRRAVVADARIMLRR